jgi:hypothetical protein
MSLHRHVVQTASYFRDGFSEEAALAELGIDNRYSATYRRQVCDEARDWNLQRLARGVAGRQ